MDIRARRTSWFHPRVIAAMVIFVVCALHGTADELTYERALEFTLGADPSVQLAHTDVRLGSGMVREAKGSFDWRATMLFDGSYERAALSDQGFAFETSRRDLLRQLADITQKIADDLQAQLDSDDTSGRVACTEAFDDNLELVIQDPNTGEEIVIRCQRPEERDDDTFNDALDALFGGEVDPELRELLNKLRNDNDEITRAQIQNVINQLNIAAIGLRRSLRVLGLAPDEREAISLQLGLGFMIPLRTGWVITPAVALRSTENNFIGKPRDPRLGGVGQPNEFLAAAGFELNVPLAKGSGYRVVTAPERAAKERYAASLDRLESQAEGELLSTGVAFWNALAAEESLRLLESTVELDSGLLDVVNALYDGFEVARTDVQQVRARLARSELDALGARRDAIDARSALAEAIGLRVESPDALPEVRGGFPAVIDPDEIDRWDLRTLTSSALAGSGQVGALIHERESARILREAARLDQRRRLDLNLFSGYTGFHESLSYSEGIEGALTGHWTGPSIIMTLSFDLPFHNDIAKAQYAQASAIEYRADVGAINERRLVVARVVQLKQALADAAREVRAQEAAVRSYEISVKNQTERLRHGEGTAVDVTLTEEQATSAKLRLVDSRRTYAVLLEQLKWASGSLVERSGEDLILTPRRLETLTSVEQEAP